MLQQNVNNIESISMKAIMDMKYHKAGNHEEMIKVKRGKLQLENFNNTEIDQLLDCLCTTLLYSTMLYLYVNLSLVWNKFQ